MESELWHLYMLSSPELESKQVVSDKPCYEYNNKGYCLKTKCTFQHRCQKCTGSHPVNMCFSSFNTLTTPMNTFQNRPSRPYFNFRGRYPRQHTRNRVASPQRFMGPGPYTY